MGHYFSFTFLVVLLLLFLGGLFIALLQDSLQTVGSYNEHLCNRVSTVLRSEVYQLEELPWVPTVVVAVRADFAYSSAHCKSNSASALTSALLCFAEHSSSLSYKPTCYNTQ